MPDAQGKIMAGSLVECELGGIRDWFFLSPVGGGMEVEAGDAQVTVITPQSPLGSSLLGKGSGASFTLPNGSKASVILIGG